MNFVSNIIGDVKPCHSSLTLGIFEGDDHKEKLERKMRVSQGSKYKTKLTRKKKGCIIKFPLFEVGYTLILARIHLIYI